MSSDVSETKRKFRPLIERIGKTDRMKRLKKTSGSGINA
jgi:hypothetical protein